MFISKVPERAESAVALRRFRSVAFVVFVIAAFFLVMQYTPYRYLPVTKTSTLWGVLTGAVAMTLFINYRWTAAARRDGNRS